MHREVHTGWESRKDALEKDTWTFMQGKAAKNCFISYTCFLCIWTIILFISMIIQCCFPDYTPYHKAFRRKYHEISIFVFWVFKPILRLVELCLWLNFSHCATCKEISRKKRCPHWSIQPLFISKVLLHLIHFPKSLWHYWLSKLYGTVVNYNSCIQC